MDERKINIILPADLALGTLRTALDEYEVRLESVQRVLPELVFLEVMRIHEIRRQILSAASR